jgi:hypothetical protein
MEELLSFIKQRASVEESYSKSMLKLSQQSKRLDTSRRGIGLGH